MSGEMDRVVPFPTAVKPDARHEAAPAVAGFYTAAEAARVARVPRRLLYQWRREGVIAPTVKTIDTDGREQIGYTFDSLVYLRLLRMLRENGITLEQAVLTMKHLSERFGPPGPSWRDARIFVQGKDVFADRRDRWEVTVASGGGQKAAHVLFGEEFERLRDRADALLIPSRFQRFVEIDPDIRSGLPIVRGTALETSTLYKLYQREQSYARIRDSYPQLTIPEIKHAIAFERFLDAEAA